MAIHKFFDFLKELHWPSLLCITAITAFGWVMLYSAAHGSIHPWAFKQIVRFIFGMGVMLAMARVSSYTWMSLAMPFYLVTLVLLICVEILGFVSLGAQRWVDLYVITIQPSELMKLALILVLARHFEMYDYPYKWKDLIKPLILAAFPLLLVLKQPDLGTAMIFVFTMALIFFLAGVSKWLFIGTGVSILTLSPILWNMLYDYQKKRILIFLNPDSDKTQAGYHVVQSKIAIGSGGFFGKGFLEGTQSHLNFLPERQTDFIFTMLTEELGFVGGVFLLILYMLLIWFYWIMIIKTRRVFNRYVIAGVMGTIFFYMVINMGMVMGVVPVVGVPLPFVSYGGTAMMTLLMAQGFVLSAYRNELR